MKQVKPQSWFFISFLTIYTSILYVLVSCGSFTSWNICSSYHVVLCGKVSCHHEKWGQKGWGFPVQAKALWLLEFPCKWHFLMPEWNGWTFEGWEMGVKGLCNKPWEVPFRCGGGSQSLLCGCVFALMKDLFPVMCSIIIRKRQTCVEKIRAAPLKWLHSEKTQLMVYHDGAAPVSCRRKPKKCSHSLNLEEPDTSCSVRFWICCLLRFILLMKVENNCCCQGIFFLFSQGIFSHLL